MATRELRLGAALFNGDHGRLAEEVARLEEAGLDFVHLDVFDGYFVSDLGFPFRTIASLRKLTDMPFEVHLGARDPLRFVRPLADSGMDRLIVHHESLALPYEDLFLMKEHGVGVGLAFTLGTPLTVLEPVIDQVEAVLLLARVTGEGSRGASFDARVYPRVREVARQAEGATVDLQVAGGVRREHVQDLVRAGVTSLAMGGGIYRVDDMAEEIRMMRSLAKETR